MVKTRFAMALVAILSLTGCAEVIDWAYEPFPDFPLSIKILSRLSLLITFAGFLLIGVFIANQKWGLYRENLPATWAKLVAIAVGLSYTLSWTPVWIRAPFMGVAALAAYLVARNLQLRENLPPIVLGGKNLDSLIQGLSLRLGGAKKPALPPATGVPRGSVCSCGHPLLPGDRLCGECGQPTSAPAPAQAAPAQAAPAPADTPPTKKSGWEDDF